MKQIKTKCDEEISILNMQGKCFFPFHCFTIEITRPFIDTGNKRMLTFSSTEYITPKDSIFGICVVTSARFHAVFLLLNARYHATFYIILEVKSS